MTAPRPMRFDVSTDKGLETFIEVRNGLLLAGKEAVFELTDSKASTLQKNALHKWCGMVAETLNDAGMDMKFVYKQDAEIPWTKDSVKEYLWRPLQLAMTGKRSTKEPSKTEYPEISETLHRHFATKFGVTLPVWPDRHGPRE